MKERAPHAAASRAVVWGVIGCFALCVAFLGGTSRPDAVQISLLRPLSALALIPALYLLSLKAVGHARVPMLLFGLLTLWMVLQLVPLPPAIWETLPDRSTLAELDKLASTEGTWRPISMVPSRGLNALASLIVPAAAMALVLGLRLSTRDVFMLIAGLGAFDALLGFAQLVTGATGPFYLHAMTNRGFAVGIFANENHSAVFSSVTMLVAMRLILNARWSQQIHWLRVFAGAAFILAMLAAITSGSRAGFVAGLLSLACSIIMIYVTFWSNDSSTRAKTKQSVKGDSVLSGAAAGIVRNPRRLATGGLVFIIALVALFVLNGRAAGLEDVLSQNSFDGLRWRIAPVLKAMMATHWVVGTGVGSFEEVYHIYEPTELLLSSYVNHAHNDWAQLIIEAGLPGLILLSTFLAWVVKCLIQIISVQEQWRVTVLSWAGIFAIVLASSALDYPVRMPTFQAVLVWLVLALALESKSQPRAPQSR